ncbi:MULTISPECIES: hypothetical protein [Pseudomonas]|jgi:hypothetical protein|uniref:hypothetical protein n=1 Tax=Pseudomonas TaxID=286 RepID=UPI000877449E|nr:MULTISPECIES: hypothetical protein [Pseudomonas]MBP3997137.1 hypothetical protein [Pseudomonas koreensis]MBX8471609.1 hypothetical protein [Pseudomonas sp. RIT778]TFA81633.1 hypothetical protein F638_5975 [Pseudomonas sp. LAIL14HWK12:I2]UVM29516.1 hypothetical protein LOY31_10760 [Pseudomonas sp. B21-021]SCZ27298.1 hypothetical protein SAMN03159313_2181 [Pseudomonas sp. NFIX46]
MKIFLDIEQIENYNFPSEFIEFATMEPKPDIEPWWLLVYKEGKINNWHNTLKKLYPKRTLVPFAKFSANDDIACFEGEDLSGNPKVLIIHAYASEGWELHGEYPDFCTWLKTAIETHAEWNEEN